MNQIRLEKDFDTILYRVRTGETLGDILKRYHGDISSNTIQTLALDVKRQNPEITNPNLIYPDQLIQLDVPRQYCAAPTSNHKMTSIDEGSIPVLKKEWKHTNQSQKDMLTALSPYVATGALGLGSASLTGLNQLLSTNSPLLQEMTKNYEKYKAGSLSKGQYDYRRRQLINQLQNKIGRPVEKILFQGRKANEVLRISRNKGSIPTQKITNHSVKMGNIAKWASRGGVALTGASLAMACHDISNTKDTNKKNEIFVETVGSVGTGLVYGAGVAIGVAIMATPIGWGAAILIGSGSVLAGLAGGKAAKIAYDRFGNEVDLLTMSGAGSVCK